ncbi:hypothetical protein KUCAC02_006527 [Chaenocephalus aceratus]|uniref:Uncharacterized protein n=1 Tax=Chaenocephalus aceratus TaxID=36190 RepID=A0ACB9VSQ4_CHAAC|nr:hypothetical protein KUCAC02_006527 [Chaenocephalus aceratus]
MEVKSKVQALSSLRKIPKINEKKIHLDSLKSFNRLILFAQRDMTVETSLAYELTPFPLSLFSNTDQKMNKANKAGFSKTSLKELTDPLDLTNQSCSTLVVDGGWLLYMVKWEQGHIDEHMDIFLDTQATKDAVIQAGTTIFQYSYHAPGISCKNCGHDGGESGEDSEIDS